MSFQLIPLAWDAQLPPLKKLVLLKLVDCANDDGSACRPSVLSIVRDCCAGERNVRRYLQEFRELGILIVEREGGGRFSTEYRIDLDALSALKTPARQEGVPHRQGRGASQAGQGCLTGTQPLKDPLKTPKKEKNAREALDFDQVKEGVRAWAADHHPDVDLEEAFEDWRDWCTAEGVEPQTQQQAVAYFRRWVRRAPKGKRSQDRPSDDTPELTFGPEVSEEDRAIFEETARLFCETYEASRWNTLFGRRAFLGRTGHIFTLELDPDSYAAEHIRKSWLGALRTALAKAADCDPFIDFRAPAKPKDEAHAAE